MYTIFIRYELNFNFIDEETQDQKDKKRVQVYTTYDKAS